MLRRLAQHQPEGFAFTPANRAWADTQIAKYPPGRQASAVIPLLWRAQEQEGWLSRPAIEHVADMLGMAYIRALEVATFYFMFQLHPVGKIANIQICGTLSCMICGAEDLIGLCRRRIADQPHQLSADGNFSWEEVECLGACANAPMVQIGKDYYEDLTVESLDRILDELAAGRVPRPGPQNGRYASEPAAGLTSLKDYAAGRPEHNASVELALVLGDTVKRIDGSETPRELHDGRAEASNAGGPAGNPPVTAPDTPPAPAKISTVSQKEHEPRPGAGLATDATGATEQEAGEHSPGAPPGTGEAVAETRPMALPAARHPGPDDLQRIDGVGPRLEALLHSLGIFHYDQIAAWTADEMAWVDGHLRSFRGRIAREGWVEQARMLAAGDERAQHPGSAGDGTKGGSPTH